MAVTFPSPQDVKVSRVLYYGHCADFVTSLLLPPGITGHDWQISVRMDDKGKVARPIILYRVTEAYQCPQFLPVPSFITIPDYVQREGERIRKELQRATRKK